MLVAAVGVEEAFSGCTATMAATITAIMAMAPNGVRNPAARSSPPAPSTTPRAQAWAPARLEARGFEEPGRALQAGATEGAEELLGAMGGDGEPSSEADEKRGAPFQAKYPRGRSRSSSQRDLGKRQGEEERE